MYKYVRVKAWFLQQNKKYAYCNNDKINGYKFTEFSEFTVKKETEKAVLINANGDLWIPKTALLEIRESEFSPIQETASSEWKELYIDTKNDTAETLKEKYEKAKADFKELCKTMDIEQAMESKEYQLMDFLGKKILK